MNGITKENVESLIYEVSEKQVMLDSDLAKLYECSNGTKDINKAVKRNIERFPRDFYFQLTKEEYENLKFQNGTSRQSKHGGVRKLPYVFTEQGVAMLASVLKTKIAAEISIRIMRAFVTMRYYINSNENRLSNVETKIIEHDKNIKVLQESFDKLSEKRRKSGIYFNGQIYDAYAKIIDIFNETKDQLVIIDTYADKKTLDIIKELNSNVIIITKKNNLLSKESIEKYNEQYNNLKVIYDNTFHDRYFIIDNEKVYHCGTSINRIGYKTFSITSIDDKEVMQPLITKIKKLIQTYQLL